ncbi:hypothetical protein [Brevundimonas denitrificans]|nr:hypothetical protein [Brevundimonas denitrificans]
MTDEPATLSVRGRLLKDEARRAPAAERPRLWREPVTPMPWPRI